VRDAPSPELLYTMGDPPNVRGATWCARTVDLMGLLQQGAVDAGFIGGAEVDRRGNVNTTAIGADRTRPDVQLPGSGGGADIASLAKRLIVIMAHEKKRLREKVDFVTSPGDRAVALITTLGVFRFVGGEAVLASYHAGASVQACADNTGWPLKTAPDVHETPSPSEEVLRIIRGYDPEGFWTRRAD